MQCIEVLYCSLDFPLAALLRIIIHFQGLIILNSKAHRDIHSYIGILNCTIGNHESTEKYKWNDLQVKIQS